jgi:autotransporter-associated beta strand protein
LLIDMLGGSLAKDVPAFRVNSGSIFFLSEAGSSLTLGGLDGPGGTIGFGPLNVTVNQVVDGTFGGDLDGTGDLTINATNNASLTASGVLSNFNSVTIGGDSTGDVTLSGNSTYTGATNVVTGGNLILSGTSQSLSIDIQTGASLTLTASDRIADAATVTNAGLFDLGANSDTVTTYTSNNGTLSGNGTLTAATYNLNNGTVINANLGDGDLIANGGVQINGNTGNGTFTVQTGTTTLAQEARLNVTTDGFIQSSFAGPVTGAGGLIKYGNATTTLMNPGNDYAGGTTIWGSTTASASSTVASTVRGAGTPFSTGDIKIMPGGHLRVADNANIASNAVYLTSDGYGLGGVGLAHNDVLPPIITTGTPAASISAFAALLPPMARIAAAGGPTKHTPAATQASANAAFSERKP